MPCEDISNEIFILKAERDSLYEELDSTVGMGRARVIAEIRELNNRIYLKERELEDCKRQNPDPYTLLTTTLSGRVAMTIKNLSDSGDMSFSTSFIANVTFDTQRTYMRLNSLEPPPLSFTYEISQGISNTTTITLRNATRNSYNRITKNLSITLPLFFNHSIEHPFDPFYEEDSNIDYALNTYGNIEGIEGRPINQDGNFVLVGSGTFAGGYLSGKNSNLSIICQLTDIP